MMSDLLSRPYGFHCAAIKASSQSDLPIVSALRCTTEVITLTPAYIYW